MSRDAIVWMVVCMVFVCGAVWGKILPGEDFWSVKVADVFGEVSAVAILIQRLKLGI